MELIIWLSHSHSIQDEYVRDSKWAAKKLRMHLMPNDILHIGSARSRTRNIGGKWYTPIPISERTRPSNVGSVLEEEACLVSLTRDPSYDCCVMTSAAINPGDCRKCHQLTHL